MKVTMITENRAKLQKCFVSAALLGLTLTVSAAQAAPPSKSLNARQAEQRRRIEQGKKSGELTRAESLRLRAREAQTRRQEARYRASGGRLTPAERARLQRDLNHDSKAIHGQKHDSQDRHR